MSLIKKSAAGLVLTAAAAATSAAFAAGFQLTEQSSLGLGRAYAGAGIVGDDLSAVHYNPAGMVLLPGVQMQAGGVWIAVDAPFKGKDFAGNSVEENGRLKGQMIPAGYITRQVNDQLWLGFAMTVPFGMGTQYDEDWAFNQRGTDSKIYTFDMNPSFAYKMNDFISFGGGISVQYAKAELGMRMKNPLDGSDIAQADVEGDSWDWGYNFGVMISPTDKLRFGLSYRSSIEHDASGTTDVSLSKTFVEGLNPALQSIAGAGVFTMNSDVTIETPDTVMLTGTWEATEKLRLSGLIRWANWSNFKSLKLQNSGAIVNLGPTLGMPIDEVEVKNNWEDTWLFSVGADYKLNNSWTVRGGIAYEMDPIDDQTTRMAAIPDTDRLWLTLGSTYKYNDDLQFDVGAAYLKGIGDKDLYSHQGAGAIKVGEYDKLDCYMVGVQMQYRF